jgi:nucleolar GTP-binding protein
MFRNIPPILNAKQLLDQSIRRTKKIQIHDRDKRFEIKKIVIARTVAFITDLLSQLESYVKNFPSIDRLPLFYQEIIDIKIDTNKLKKSLGAVDWARKTVEMVYMTQSSSLTKSGNVEFLKQKQKEIYGRVSSIVKQVDKNLVFLANAQKILRTFPDRGHRWVSKRGKIITYQTTVRCKTRDCAIPVYDKTDFCRPYGKNGSV